MSIYQNTTKRKDFGVCIIGPAHYVSSPLEIIRESGRILGNRGVIVCKCGHMSPLPPYIMRGVCKMALHGEDFSIISSSSEGLP